MIDARDRAGLTQIDVARALDKRQSFVSKYESGERKLEVVEFVQVCQVLGQNPKTVIAQIEEKL
ncbi:MAG: helix-turn-helix transcriptional regulator [Flavobacteriales bacterium]